MLNLNFLYWLQGHFELDQVRPLDIHQIKMIREHLSYIKDSDHPFVSWFTGFLDASDADPVNVGLHLAKVILIKEKLQAAIDATQAMPEATAAVAKKITITPAPLPHASGAAFPRKIC